ncbi:MAG: TerD family protein [Lachnospiraceae bacterium]|nr:TerD family protein [Lachnospiraceae bacterium]
MNAQRGMRDKLEKYLNVNGIIDVYMNIAGGGVYDYCCFGVDAQDKLSDDRYMVFYNQTRSPGGEISYVPESGGAHFQVNLTALPFSINKLVFTVSIDGGGTMGQIQNHALSIRQNNAPAIDFYLQGSDFMNEKAIISIEIYKKDVWRFSAVGRGFNGGLGDLLRSYGGEEMKPVQNPGPAPNPMPNRNPAPNPMPNRAPDPPKKVELRKGQKVSLIKQGSSLGEVLINLNWSQPKQGLFGFMQKGIDLDLGCLFELKNGLIGSVQALGNTFGSLQKEPYIALDGDDRTGASAGGENLRVNGAHIAEIKRILVYTFIYEGTTNWRDAQGVVSVKCPGSQEIIVRMDEYGSNLPMCAIAMLENENNQTFTVEKIVRFFEGHRFMDQAFNWGLKWVAGKK